MDNSIFEKKIEQTRKLMIKSGIENGLLDVKTIQLSKKLDQLLNLYHQRHYTEKNHTTFKN